MIVGSPAANLAARAANQGACFSFLVSPDDLKGESDFEKRLNENPYDSDFLAEHLNVNSSDPVCAEWAKHRKKLLHGFARSGIFDPFDYTMGPTAPQRKGTVDFGIVTLCKHPWSEDSVAILAAGIGGPATAAALKWLATPGVFDRHPLGGVFHVNVSREAAWDDRYGMLHPKWDTREYDLEAYEKAISAYADS
ncbi:MAG: hypothetical protein MUP47_07310, partial [Phycisphaerae bacterium]|nr:hypothetical protein [Phycisphaerae bacterium]